LSLLLLATTFRHFFHRFSPLFTAHT
jgi:hypothetical protein